MNRDRDNIWFRKLPYSNLTDPPMVINKPIRLESVSFFVISQKNIMKKISLLFVVSFLFFVIGQMLWNIRMFTHSPVFGEIIIDDYVTNIIFSLCSIFGLIGSYKWYKQS